MKKFFYTVLSFFLVNIANATADTYVWLNKADLRDGNVSFWDIPKMVNALSSWLLWISATVAMVMIIIWAYKIALWSLNNQVQKWKEAITMGIVGLVVAVSAWFIINVIISNL